MTRKRKANITPEDVGTFYTDGEKVYHLADCETEPLAIMVALGAAITFEKPISEFANFVRLRPERPIVKPVTPRKPRSDKGTQHKPKQVSAPPGEAQAETTRTLILPQRKGERKPKVEQALTGIKPDTGGDIQVGIMKDGKIFYDNLPAETSKEAQVSLKPKLRYVRAKKKIKSPIVLSGDIEPAKLPDISTFSIVIGHDGELHQIRLGAQVVGCKTLKEGITQILAKFGIDLKYIEAAPESEGKRNLLGILRQTGHKYAVLS